MAAGQAGSVVLWNAFPFHPHGAAEPLSNRRPTPEEVDAQAKVLNELTGLFNPNCQIIAVGNVARDHLQVMGIEATQFRHPANGGTADFIAPLQNLWNLAVFALRNPLKFRHTRTKKRLGETVLDVLHCKEGMIGQRIVRDIERLKWLWVRPQAAFSFVSV